MSNVILDIKNTILIKTAENNNKNKCFALKAAEGGDAWRGCSYWKKGGRVGRFFANAVA